MKARFSSSLLALAASCASPEQVWIAPVAGVVPSGTGDTWVLDRTGARHPELGIEPAPQHAGELRAIAKDQSSGYAAAMFDGALATVDIDNDLVEWSSISLPGGPASLHIGASMLGAIAGTRAALFTLPEPGMPTEFELSEWLDTFALQRADALMPLSEVEFVLVASRLPSTFQDGRVVVQRIDRSRGAFELVRDAGDVAGITRLGATTSVAGTLYLAGIRERLAKGTGTNRGSLHQNIVAFRYDPATGTSRQVVDEHQIAMNPRVLDVAAGRDPVTGVDLLAVLNATGELRVYDVPSEGVSSAPRFANTYSGATCTAWLSPDRIAVVLKSGETRVVTIAR